MFNVHRGRFERNAQRSAWWVSGPISLVVLEGSQSMREALAVVEHDVTDADVAMEDACFFVGLGVGPQFKFEGMVKVVGCCFVVLQGDIATPETMGDIVDLGGMEQLVYCALLLDIREVDPPCVFQEDDPLGDGAIDNVNTGGTTRRS